MIARGARPQRLHPQSAFPPRHFLDRNTSLCTLLAAGGRSRGEREARAPGDAIPGRGNGRQSRLSPGTCKHPKVLEGMGSVHGSNNGGVTPRSRNGKKTPRDTILRIPQGAIETSTVVRCAASCRARRFDLLNLNNLAPSASNRFLKRRSRSRPSRPGRTSREGDDRPPKKKSTR